VNGLPVAPVVPLVFATDVGFVALNVAAESRRLRLGHRLSDAVTEVPRRLECHTERAFHLVRADAFLGFAHEQDGHEPLRHGQVRVVEHGPGRDGEAIPAGIMTRET